MPTVRAMARGRAELLVTAGVLVLLFAVYLVVWSDVRTAAAQQDLQAEFDETTEAVSTPAAPGQPVEVAPYEPGEGIAEMTIPRLGEDWKWIVVEGVDTEDIAKGPGHFPGTAAPGRARQLRGRRPPGHQR